MRVRIIKNWSEPDLLRQTPDGSGRWEEFQFSVGESAEPCDWLLALNNRFDTDQHVRMPPERVVALMQEPFVPGFTDWMDRDLQAFHVVFSSHRPSMCRRWQRSHPAVAWHVNRSYSELQRMAMMPKSRLASWICGGARALPGHRERLGFLKRLQTALGSGVDLFGRAVMPIVDKWDGLAPYAYSLAIENTVRNDYWTEKVADCFLAWTCPIYHGAANLAEYVPEGSFIRIDIRRPREAIEIIRRTLDGGDVEWRRRIEAITEARSRVLDHWQLFPHMARQIRALAHPAGPPSQVTIPAHRRTLRSSLRRRWERWRGAVERLSRLH